MSESSLGGHPLAGRSALVTGGGFAAGRGYARALAAVGANVVVADPVLTEPSSLPHGGVHKGIDAFHQVQAGMAALWEQRIEWAEYWPSGTDRVTLRIVIRWTARATGRSVTLPMIDFIQFGGGMIIAVEAFVFDTAALLATLDQP